uniref:Uncharacterized protein n=1 Tax=uncultured alpha proteobacterium HF0130_06E21 TaxID=710808 RepID=E0XT28_9PROT|nr:hypothetical protein [uncultured alpha proteobacterium HF0130_06E21]
MKAELWASCCCSHTAIPPNSDKAISSSERAVEVISIRMIVGVT